MIYVTLPKRRAKILPMKYVSKTEELFFLVLEHSFQNMYNDVITVMETNIKGFRFGITEKILF